MSGAGRGQGVGEAWDQHARWWQENHTAGADPEYEEQILPLVVEHTGDAARVLDLGCGEGQVARALIRARPGRRVVGLDLSSAQLTEACSRAGGPSYARGEAVSVPFPDAGFDAVVACLVFDHVVALDPALDEVARVLAPGGRFVFVVNHPLMQTPDSGWIDDRILDEHYWRVGPYAIERVWDEEITPGVSFPFVHRPLSRYVNAMADRGLAIEQMVEPLPSPGFVAQAPEYSELVGIPRLLVLALRREG